MMIYHFLQSISSPVLNQHKHHLTTELHIFSPQPGLAECSDWPCQGSHLPSSSPERFQGHHRTSCTQLPCSRTSWHHRELTAPAREPQPRPDMPPAPPGGPCRQLAAPGSRLLPGRGASVPHRRGPWPPGWGCSSSCHSCPCKRQSHRGSWRARGVCSHQSSAIKMHKIAAKRNQSGRKRIQQDLK